LEQLASRRVFDLFRELRERPFVLVEPGGNHGDSLIYRGAEKLARAAGVSYTALSHAEFMGSACDPDAVIYLHGSGGYNSWCSGKPMLELEKAVATHPGVVVQGPATFHDDPSFLLRRVVGPLERRRATRLFVFARERVSYDAIRHVLPGWTEPLLDHDTALNLDLGDLDPGLEPGGHTLYAIRQDMEAREFRHRDFFGVWADPWKVARSFEPWLRLHAEAAEIVTNRLHSSITGCILGRPTTLLPNSYFKNRAVWEHSLCERGVRWSEEPSVGGLGRFLSGIAPARTILGAKPVQRLVRTCHGIG
jgi:hypothetical protein